MVGDCKLSEMKYNGVYIKLKFLLHEATEVSTTLSYLIKCYCEPAFKWG